MKKINSLILLVQTLSKSEKKAIYLQSNLTKGKKIYMELFELIEKQKINESASLHDEFRVKFSEASFHPVAKYLYEFIMTVLVNLKTGQDKEFSLYQKIMNAKILAERNLDAEYYATLQQLKVEAQEVNNFHLLLIIQRMELDFLRTNGFPDVSEKKLSQKQHKINDTLKILRQINEQSSLYELLLFRTEKIPMSEAAMQKQFFNDLVVSEISLVSNLNKEVFEIQKLHQLFQAQYLIAVGDYKSALNSFIELNKLFEANQNLWNNPPLYYATVLEGILESLRGIQKYDKMSYFFDKLSQLKHPSTSFQTEIACIEFINIALPYIEQDNKAKCMSMIEEYKTNLIMRVDQLTPYRYMQLSLCLSRIYIINGKFAQARKQITRIINSDSYLGIWLFRPIQLVNLIIHYELGDFDIITSRVRSIKRQNKIKKKNSKLENLLFHFLGVDLISQSDKHKADLKSKLEREFATVVDDNEDRRALSVFNFEKWIFAHFD